MNWNKILPAVVAAAFLVSAGVATAQDESKTQEQAGAQGQATGKQVTTMESQNAKPQSELRTVTLTVKSVDRANNRVQFEAQVDPEAKVKRGSEELRVNQLQPGDSVRASFDPVTGQVERMEVIEKINPQSKQPSQGMGEPSPGMEEPGSSGEPSY